MGGEFARANLLRTDLANGRFVELRNINTDKKVFKVSCISFIISVYGERGGWGGGSHVLVGSKSCGYTSKAHDVNHASDVTTQCGFYVPSRF